MKQKLKHDQIVNLKKQKMNLVVTIKPPSRDIIKETLLATVNINLFIFLEKVIIYEYYMDVAVPKKCTLVNFNILLLRTTPKHQKIGALFNPRTEEGIH